MLDSTHRCRIGPIASLLAAVFATLALAVPDVAWAGKLDKVRKRTKGSSTSSKHKGRSSSDASYGGGGGDEFGMAMLVLASPWWLPHMAVGDRIGRTFAFDSHPYAGGYDGFVHVAGQSAPMAGGDGGRSLLGRGAAMQAAVEGGWLDPTIQRVGLSARISGHHRFEIETAWSGYQELLGPAERASGRVVDALWIGDVNVTWLHAVGESVLIRSGGGIRSMVDAGETTLGVNLTYGMDIFPVQPLVISLSGDIGTVGQALYRGVRATLGFMVGRVEIYGGYDGAWVDEISLGGGLFGVRAWL